MQMKTRMPPIAPKRLENLVSRALFLPITWTSFAYKFGLAAQS